MSKRIGLMVGSLILLRSLGASAESYTYHPRTVMVLGHGFEPNNLSDPKMACLDFAVEPAPGEPAALESTLETYVVHDVNQLKTILKVDVRVEASYLTQKASAGFKLETEQMFRRDSITLMVVSRSEYGKLVLKPKGLTPLAAEILRNRPGEFASECGTHLVKMVQRGTMVAVFLTITDLTEEQKRKLETRLEAGGSSGAFSAEAKAGFDDILERSLASHSVRIQAISTGGEGAADFEKLIRNFDSLGKVYEGISEFMKRFGAANAAPIAFHTGPFGFGFEPGLRIWDQQRQKRLARLADRYAEVELLIRDIEQVLKPSDPRSPQLDAQWRRDLERSGAELDAYHDRIANAHRDCMATRALEKCVLPAFANPVAKVPEMPPVPVMLATPSGPSRRATDLEVTGFELISIQLYIGRELVSELALASPPKPGIPVEVPLDRFWQVRKGRIRGSIAGTAVLRDRYGRKTSYVFFRAIHSEQGSFQPYHQTFSRKGEL